MSKDVLYIRGAREHNLKDVEVAIPREKFVVLTGVSGSGKHPWLLIPYMQKDSAGMLNHCPLMPASSLV